MLFFPKRSLFLTGKTEHCEHSQGGQAEDERVVAQIAGASVALEGAAEGLAHLVGKGLVALVLRRATLGIAHSAIG